MAKSYAQSVKLPNLVAVVAHPSTKFMSRDGLNVEGHRSALSTSCSHNNELAIRSSGSLNETRRAYISSLIESGNEANRKRRDRDATSIKSDQVNF